VRKGPVVLSEDYFVQQEARLAKLIFDLSEIDPSLCNPSPSPIFAPAWEGECRHCPKDGAKRRATHGILLARQSELTPSIEGGPSNSIDCNYPTACAVCAETQFWALDLREICGYGCGCELKTESNIKHGTCFKGEGCLKPNYCDAKTECGDPCGNECGRKLKCYNSKCQGVDRFCQFAGCVLIAITAAGFCYKHRRTGKKPNLNSQPYVTHSLNTNFSLC